MSSNLLPPIILGVSAFVFALVLTPVFRDLALRLGLVDRPDHTRKLHAGPIPRIGGVPILLAYAASFAILLLLGLHGSLKMQVPLPLVWKLVPAALLVFCTGLYDDLVGLKPWQKLAGLASAAVLARLGGLEIDTIAGYEIGSLGTPLVILWLVGCSNAFNLIDGVDGLASGVGLLATITTLAAALLHGDTGLVIATAPLAGALFGFLRSNFNPASIFLGDCGSLLVGFMLGCYGVIWSQKSATLLGMTAPLMALSLPLLDTALSIARRYLSRRPIFAADHGHIHHRLLERGLTPRRVTLLLYGVSAVAAGLALLQSMTQTGFGRLTIPLFCAVVWIGVRYLGYQEFRIAATLLRQSDFRSMIHCQLSLRRYEDSLKAAATPEECWRHIRAAGGEFGFSHVALHLGGRSFNQQLDESIEGRWISHVPISDLEYVQLARRFEPSAPPMAIAQLIELLHRVLSEKSVQFHSRTQSKTATATATAERASVLQESLRL